MINVQVYNQHDFVYMDLLGEGAFGKVRKC
jgi:hypothetical protein